MTARHGRRSAAGRVGVSSADSRGGVARCVPEPAGDRGKALRPAVAVEQARRVAATSAHEAAGVVYFVLILGEAAAAADRGRARTVQNRVVVMSADDVDVGISVGIARLDCQAADAIGLQMQRLRIRCPDKLGARCDARITAKLPDAPARDPADATPRNLLRIHRMRRRRHLLPRRQGHVAANQRG